MTTLPKTRDLISIKLSSVSFHLLSLECGTLSKWLTHESLPGIDVNIRVSRKEKRKESDKVTKENKWNLFFVDKNVFEKICLSLESEQGEVKLIRKLRIVILLHRFHPLTRSKLSDLVFLFHWAKVPDK